MRLLKLHVLRAWQPCLIHVAIQLTGIVTLMAAWQFHQHHANATQDLLRRLATLKNEQQTWHHQQNLLHEYLPQYQKLLQNQSIGYAQPQLWLQQLKHIQQTHQLYAVHYTMHEQHTCQTSIQGLQATCHPMLIEMDLLHELDLLTLLNKLKDSHVGNFVLNSCKLNTLGTDQELQRLKPHLHAKCGLDWVTLAPVAALQSP